MFELICKLNYPTVVNSADHLKSCSWFSVWIKLKLLVGLHVKSKLWRCLRSERLLFWLLLQLTVVQQKLLLLLAIVWSQLTFAFLAFLYFKNFEISGKKLLMHNWVVLFHVCNQLSSFCKLSNCRLYMSIRVLSCPFFDYLPSQRLWRSLKLYTLASMALVSLLNIGDKIIYW